MTETDTRWRLEHIPDAGLFEELATAVLREQDARWCRLSHVGVNSEGKSVKSPSDGIAYISDADGLRMVAVHHTTCARKELRRKWLADPDGDVEKAARIFREQKERILELRATLILTTNRDPPESLVHDIHAAGYRNGMEVEILPGSSIAHFLDAEPRGQWLRRNYLGVLQAQLSEELLRELAVRSIANASPPDREAWVNRDFDKELADDSREGVRFVVGESGMGKTVACLKWLQDHVESGGLGLVVSDELLWESQSLVDAVDTALRRLHPSLAPGAGHEALLLASEARPLCVVVEDVNRSAWPARIMEKLANWNDRAAQQTEPARWHVLCPVWPRTTALLNDTARKSIGKSSVWLSRFREEEGIAAVRRRGAKSLSPLGARAVAASLGYDPLLIALHDHGSATGEPKSVIGSYVGASVGRLASGGGRYTAGEYRHTLTLLSLEMMERRQLEPGFRSAVEWTAREVDAAETLRELVGAGEVLRLEGAAERERIVFRHDRVRDYLLADALGQALDEGERDLPALSDPFFSDVVGLALAGGETKKAMIRHVAEVNPLALFSAMRHFPAGQSEAARDIVDEATSWAESGAPKDLRNGYLRSAVLRVLAECEGPHVTVLAERIDGNRGDWWALRARFRNGDLGAGIRLCAKLEPGIRMVGHVELIDHVLQKYGARMLRALDKALRRRDLGRAGRSGALRLAGYAGSLKLTPTLQESWRTEGSRQELLKDYVWACSQCCGAVPSDILNPVFDQWAAMAEETDDGREHPRAALGTNHLRWAFRDRVPRRAIGYFLQRANGPDLRWPILLMLNGIDDPDAIEFVVRELAQRDEETEGTGGLWPFEMMAVEEWGRRSRCGGAPMEAASRERLRDLWSDNDKGKHLRRRALQFWCATIALGDMDFLKAVDTDSEVGDIVLFQRLRRGDRTAIPELTERLDGGRSRYWWQAGRFVWSDELTECLDQTLCRIAGEGTERETTGDLDWTLSELLMELPSAMAERLIDKHWSGLSCSPRFVQAALYVGSARLRTRVREVVDECDKPESLFEHIAIHFGIRMEGRRGIVDLSQIEMLRPYLDYLSDSDVLWLWEACNENGWFDWRREHLDSLIKGNDRRFVDRDSALRELDKELADKHGRLLVDRWGKLVLETGVSLDGMMEMVKEWLGRHEEEEALRFAVVLVTRFGRRRHLEILRRHKFERCERGQAIIADASFEIRQRSLE